MTDEIADLVENKSLFTYRAVYPDATSLFTSGNKTVSDVSASAIVVLDTAPLLVPYGVSKASLDQIRGTYQGLAQSGRLKIPGQVAREFAINRPAKLAELFQQFTRKRSLFGQFGKGNYPLLDSLTAYQELVKTEDEIKTLLERYAQQVDQVIDYIRMWEWRDPVSTMYADVFLNGVVHDPDFDEKTIAADLERRNSMNIPPGYKDRAKRNGGAGDLIIWHTILDIGKETKRDLLFVTGDEKADWWVRSEGQPLYPRFELVDEYHRASSGSCFHILQFSKFLDLLGASQEVVQEVQKEELTEREAANETDLQPGTVAGPVGSTVSPTLIHVAAERWMRARVPANAIIRRQVPFHHLAPGGKRWDFVVVQPDKASITIVDVLALKAFTPRSDDFVKATLRDLEQTLSSLKVHDRVRCILMVGFVDELSAFGLAENAPALTAGLSNVELVVGHVNEDGRFVEVYVEQNSTP